MLRKTYTPEFLERAAAQLLMMAEVAPRQPAREMRDLAARLQMLSDSPFFIPEQQLEEFKQTEPPKERWRLH